MRLHLRKLYMGLATVIGVNPQGFFIPYRYANQIPAPDKRLPYGAIEDLFKQHESQFNDLISQLKSFDHDLRAIGNDAPPRPRWRQDWFPGLDAAIAYTMVRQNQPKRLVEVGSGHSTRFLARAAIDGGVDVSITAIDPMPRADITKLGVSVIQKTVQEAGLSPFQALEDGDVLSIDSSHLLMPGSDVDLLFNGVLPGLPAGVLVHIHDIFLPDGYPASWEWRGYNEQLGVVPLLYTGGYDLLWSSHYVRTRLGQSLEGKLFDHILPPEGGLESSLWLRKRSAT